MPPFKKIPLVGYRLTLIICLGKCLGLMKKFIGTEHIVWEPSGTFIIAKLIHYFATPRTEE